MNRSWRLRLKLALDQAWLQHLVGGCLIFAVLISATHMMYGRYQGQQHQRQAQLVQELIENQVTPTPFRLSLDDGQVLGQSLSRKQQYDYLMEHVTNWDTPCYRQAIAQAKQYQPQSSAFDYLVSELWRCTE